MDLHLVGQILAVVWIAISLWIGGLNAFILFVLLAGIGQQGARPVSIRSELGAVVFFLTSGIAVATWAFDSPRNFPRHLGSMLLPLALCALAAIAVRFRSGHDRW